MVLAVSSNIGPTSETEGDRRSVFAVAAAKAAARLTVSLPPVLLVTLIVATVLVFASFPAFASSFGSALGWELSSVFGFGLERAGFAVVVAFAVPIAGAALISLDAAARLSAHPPRPRFVVIWLVVGVLAAVLLIAGLVWAVVGWRRTVPLMLNLIGLVILVAPLVQLLRMLLASIRNDALRRVLGIATDVGAFWPRHMHPFAPRPYGGVVVDALEAEIDARLGGGVVVAGHSQGSVIAAVALSRRERATARLGFLSYGSPLASLYIAMFPRVFNDSFVSNVADVTGGRWVNLRRPSDPIANTPIVGPGAVGYRPEATDPNNDPAKDRDPASATDIANPDAASDSAIGKPASDKPGIANTDADKLDAAKPAAASESAIASGKPGTGNTANPDAAIAKPASDKPGTGNTDADKPAAARDADKPAAASESVIAKPASDKPGTVNTDGAIAKPGTDKPGTSNAAHADAPGSNELGTAIAQPSTDQHDEGRSGRAPSGAAQAELPVLVPIEIEVADGRLGHSNYELSPEFEVASDALLKAVTAREPQPTGEGPKG